MPRYEPDESLPRAGWRPSRCIRARSSLSGRMERGEGLIFFVLWLLGIAVGAVTSILDSSMRTVPSVAENLLFYQMTITVGLSGLVGFVGHTLFSDRTAESIGWPTGNYFQKELGLAELGWALAGLAAVFYSGTIAIAIVVMVSPLFVGAAVIHIIEVRERGNFSPGNYYAILPDLLIPATLIVLSLLAGIW
jgi:Family of unknown function (DUF6790)